jgi:ectoine hydroxylase-related dioxygenase (phytanoyl-CoA dioxygenase family)
MTSAAEALCARGAGLTLRHRKLGAQHAADDAALAAAIHAAAAPRAGAAAQALHRDDGLYPVPRPHQELVCSVMWAIDAFTEANGGTCLIPASHGDFAGEPSARDAISVSMPAGAAIMYVGSLWHGGGANRTDTVRRGVVMHYAARGCDRPRTIAWPYRVGGRCRPGSRSCSAECTRVPRQRRRRHPQRLLD